MGDFYETFDQDAELISKELDIVLTSREMGKGQKVPLAGIPYHSVESYLSRLINHGYKVAICEQVSNPATSKGLVDREVVRLVTPGTVIEPSLLKRNINSFLASLTIEEGIIGLAFVDVTTGEFGTTTIPASQLFGELTRLNPSEILTNLPNEKHGLGKNWSVTKSEEYLLSITESKKLILNHFGIQTLDTLGLGNTKLCLTACAQILKYLLETQKEFMPNLSIPYYYNINDYLLMGPQTIKNLEIFDGSRNQNSLFSLSSILDVTKTPMGGRLLRKWLRQPLINIEELNRRLDCVEVLIKNSLSRTKLTSLLKSVADLERLINRIRISKITHRELLNFNKSLGFIPDIKNILHFAKETPLLNLLNEIQSAKEIHNLIGEAINSDIESIKAGVGIIKTGFCVELDEVRSGFEQSIDYIAKLERTEKTKTGIKSLKIGFNRVFGYFIEISRSNLKMVPDNYIRKQTLVGGERYITPELKEYEILILNAEERIKELEAKIFNEICEKINVHSTMFLNIAKDIANIDLFCSLADVALNNEYVRPELTENGTIKINNGRHPIVERSLPSGTFVPNDTILSNHDSQLIILTGPNMSGKSTYIRQVAIITLMAQIGSFVPAKSASISIVDQIFTRVGLQDDLSVGQSTFMVEMVETAVILNNATSKSLVILDEIGRGTSTYDGLSIAKSVAEYIHDSPQLGCKTLFATHYHELTQLPNNLHRAKNYNVVVSEHNDKVVFLHRITKGKADKSYGIHVAKLAGLPSSVISKATKTLIKLEQKSETVRTTKGAEDGHQLRLMDNQSDVLKKLVNLDLSSITPIQAMNILFELQGKANDEH